MSDKEEQAPPPAPEAPKDVEGKKEDKKEEKKEEKKKEDGGERNDFVKFANKVAADSIGNWFQADKFEVHHHHHHADPINERPEKWRRYNPGASDFDFVPDGAPKEVAEDIPVSPEQFDDWFYVLSDYERCFVLVMAALHGRRVSDVVERAKQLYTPFRAAQQKQDEKNEQEIRISRNKLEKRLFIMTRRGSGIDRFYWQDTDANRDSEFSMRLVHYIAGEAALGFGVSNGYSFYEQLCQWVNDNDTDIACRAAKALGVFWWKNSTKVLENEIDKWARSDRGSDWDRAAWCLEGAYTIDYILHQEAANDVRNSPVLKKLRDWVIKARRRQDVSLGSTAAITYSLLGKQSPQVGMRGLDALLELPKVEVEQDYEDMETLLESYRAVIFCYCDLVIYGRIREIFQHLAAYVKFACYNRVRSSIHDKEEQLRQEAQRELRLAAAFNILLSIATASFVNPEDLRSASYQTKGTLPEKPIMDNRKATDLLLEGILLEGEHEWRNSISTLLCGALVEKNPELAFLLLRRWAACVMRDQSTQPDDVRTSYVRFMRDLAIQADTWYHHLQQMRIAVPPVVTAFVRNLEAWKPAYRPSLVHGYAPISLLAQEVLSELPYK